MITWKEWSQSTKVAVLLIFALLIIPKADAVDALKTCTCLLKECRYGMYHAVRVLELYLSILLPY